MKKDNNIICIDSVYLAYCYVKEDEGYSFVGEKLVRRVPDDMGVGVAYQEVGSSFAKYQTIDKVREGEMGLDDIRPLEEIVERNYVSKYVEIDYFLKLYYEYVSREKVRKRVI